MSRDLNDQSDQRVDCPGRDDAGSIASQALGDQAVSPDAEPDTGDCGPYYAEPGRNPTSVEGVLQEESARRDERYDTHDQQSPLADPLLEVLDAPRVGFPLDGRIGGGFCTRPGPRLSSRRRA